MCHKFDFMLNSDISFVIPWEMLVTAVTLNRADPPRGPEIRYSIRCDKFGDQRWHRTS